MLKQFQKETHTHNFKGVGWKPGWQVEITILLIIDKKGVLQTM